MIEFVALLALAWRPVVVMAAVVVTVLLAWVFQDHSDAPESGWPREDWRQP